KASFHSRENNTPSKHGTKHLGAAWGLLLTLAVLGYVLYRANYWLTGIVKNKYAFLRDKISSSRNRNDR
ncbi:hypothetical protein, partial [Acetobacter senegalensis]